MHVAYVAVARAAIAASSARCQQPQRQATWPTTRAEAGRMRKMAAGERRQLPSDALTVTQRRRWWLSGVETMNSGWVLSRWRLGKKEKKNMDFRNKEKQVLVRGLKRGNLYALEENKELTFTAIRGDVPNSDVWHKRLGHPSPKETRHIVEFPSCDEWLELTSVAPITQDTKSNHTTCHAHAQKECLGISNPHAIPPQIQMPLAQTAV
ncbi:hypothetical protein WN944_007046 [Citrus x changshan-huyou]|uniref:GAG-pre-integrase domain-containing protein n=1 Tax=Citrus x changshan-huyou TaxID=2935761 RepID=A0AAP0MKA5_9ROSI